MKYILEYSEYNNSIQEEQDIKDNAISDNTFMKAPNGKKTNLTEKQWLQVRTKNFINWFGDWLNDPENASKIVDNNREPMVVYHGTSNIFDTFDTDKTMDGIFWFCGNLDKIKNKEVSACGYDIIKEVFLSIKNPAGWDEEDRLSIDEMIRDGFDGQDLSEDNGDLFYTTFYPTQIKSATNNNGDFDPNNENINK